MFLRLQTQWRVGMNGPVGLVYDTLGFWLELEAVPRADWPAVVSDVQRLEHEALRLMRAQR